MVTIMARSAFSAQCRAHFNKRHSLGLSLESLETRVCLSANLGLASQNHQQIQWNGHTVEARADSWIVHTASTSLMPASSFNLATHWQTASLGEGFYSLTAPGAGVQDVVNWAAGTVGVASVEPDFVIAPTIAPNDPTFSQLWGLNNVGQSGGVANADINAPEAWNTTTGSRTVVVAVIDTGIDYTHPDLAANAWHNPGEVAGDGIDNDGNGYVDDVYGWDFANNDSNPMDDNGHGTHVSGTIGAVGNNGVGVAGVNWQVSIMGLKFLSGAGSGSTSGAIAAINYATRMRRDFGINIVASNNSWGGGGFSTSLRDAIEAGGRAGILFVAAAGNEAGNNDGATLSYPASYTSESIISVAATDRTNTLASFSNYGATSVDLAAPGVSILSTTPNNTYASYSGTSMATPHVTGTIALLAAAYPQATASAIRTAILTGTTPVAGLAGKVASGGLLDASAALQRLGNLTAPVAPPVTPPPASANPLEPNDSIASATIAGLVNGRAAFTGFVGDGANTSGDVDMFAITVAAGMAITVDVDAGNLPVRSTLNSFARVFDVAGRQLTNNDDFGGSQDSYLVFVAPVAGTYYVGLSASRNSSYNPLTAGSGTAGTTTGAYAVTFTVALPMLAADIIDVTPDPRTTAVASIAIALNRPVTGVDISDLQLTRNGINVPLTGAVIASTNGVLWTLSGLTAATSSIGIYTLTLNAGSSGIVDTAGRALASSASDTWTVLSATLPDAGDTLAKATAVAVVTGDVRLAGRIGDNRYGAKDVDFYRVSLRAGQQFVIDIDARSLAGSSTLDSYVRLFNASGRRLASNDDSGGSLDSYLVYTAPTAGTYFVGVSGYGNAAYTPMQDNSGRNGSVGTYQISLGVSSMPARSNTNTIHMLGFADGDVTPTHNARRFQMQAAFAAFGASWMGTPQPSTGRTTLFTL